jgi:flagellar biosynthesis protein FlhA
LPPQDNEPILPGPISPDILLPVGIVTVLIMIVIPMPTILMNLLIVLNIGGGVIILLTVTYMDRAVNFSVFPSLLLSYNVFGLAVNVTTTRNILLGGPERAQGVITAFGEFVMGGNVIVGVIVFTIIIVIEYLVIVRGTTRVSEVAARFILDSMPGKQMAIDADLNAGLIDQREAQQRRKELREEADFYGAMDGASKFVQGSVIAGIIILLVNSLGGWSIGVFMEGLAPLEALQTYVILTAGDGLAAQIPVLMIGTATGLIVTQASDEGDLGTNLAGQLTRFPKALYVTGGTLITLGVLTPLPFVSMVLVGGGMVGLGLAISRMRQAAREEAERRAEEKEAADEDEEEPEDVSQALRVDPMELETGYALIPLVDPDQGGDLLERITVIRRRMALDMGLIVPPIRIRDNMQLDPNSYVINIRNAEVAKGEVYPEEYLAMNPGDVSEELEGEQTIEPAFGLPATWIDEEQREKAERAGYTVVDPSSVIATHLTEVIKDHAADILGREQIQTMIERLEEDYPALVEDVYQDPVTPGKLQKVLELLLDEKVSVRNLVTIVETMADRMQQGITDADLLAEYCRMALGREITQEHTNEEDVLYALSLDPSLEQELQEMSDQGEGLQLSPDETQQLIENLREEYEGQQESGLEPVLLVAPEIRRSLYELTRQQFDALAVLSYQEVSEEADVEVVGVVG